MLAVGLFAVAYPMTRYAAEAKPYGCDLFIALAIFALTIEWLRRPNELRWLWYLAALIGPAVGYSFPAVFIGGGASLVTGWMLLLRTRFKPTRSASEGGDGLPRWRFGLVFRSGWLPWFVCNVVLVAGVVTILLVSRHSVGSLTQQNMEEGWATSFPPIAQPLKLPYWLLETHAGAMLGYPVGGPNWGSSFSLVFLLIGAGRVCAAAAVVVVGPIACTAGLELRGGCHAPLSLRRACANDPLSRSRVLHAHRLRLSRRAGLDHES